MKEFQRIVILLWFWCYHLHGFPNFEEKSYLMTSLGKYLKINLQNYL